MHVMHLLGTHLLAQASQPSFDEVKAIAARVIIAITTLGIISLAALLAFHFFQYMTGGEEGAVKAKAGFRHVIFGFGGLVLTDVIAAGISWVFAPAISKFLAGG